MQPIDLWERFPQEPRPAFRAFSIYRDLGAARTLDEAFRRWSAEGTVENRVPPTQDFLTLSLDWFWQKRAAAFDRFQRQLQRIGDETRRREREQNARQQLDALAERVQRLEMLASQRIEACLSRSLESTTYRGTRGGETVVRVIDKGRTLRQLCAAEKQLASLSLTLRVPRGAKRRGRRPSPRPELPD